MSFRVNYQPEALFTIETNNEFVWRETKLTPGIAKAAAEFGIAPIYEVAIVGKRNPNSNLYWLKSDNDFILRQVDLRAREITGQQCFVASATPYQNIVKPIIARDGSYALAAEGSTWMAYPKKAGQVFSGLNCSPLKVIDEAIKLERSFGIVESSLSPESREFLPVVQHHPEHWREFFVQLVDADRSAKVLPTKLSFATQQLLFNNPEIVGRWIEPAVELSLKDHFGLTHNDLQHANVLIDERGEPFFLDLEDICLENRKIAISHAVFKLLRHTAFTRAQPPTRLRSLLPAVLELLNLNDFDFADRQELFLYGAYRIVSDIWEIVDYTTRFDQSQLYDLEKRIQNLFELFYLVSEEDESVAAR